MMMTKEELCSISGVSREILDHGLNRIASISNDRQKKLF